MERRLVALCAAVFFVLALVPTAFGAPGGKNKDTLVQLLAINDFHGNLQPPSGSGGRIQVGPPLTPGGSAQTVNAGGAEYLATWIKSLRTTNPNTITVGGGDLIGASPLISGLFHDEPTIESMNAIGMDVTSVGNHEFDEGIDELLRMQFGNQLGGDGCHPVDGCQDGTPFGGALFQYLAANVFYEGTENTILPPYQIRKVGNAKIAFIGLTLEGTPLIVTPAGVAGLEFRPEIGVINNLVADLRANQGVRAFVVLIHQGGQQNGPFPLGYMDSDRCDNFSGDIIPIVNGLSSQVDVVVSAHTHQPYICHINGKLVTSAASFGRLITDIDLRIDHQTKDVKSATAHNVIVTRDVASDPDQVAIINKYNALSGPIANRVVGSQSADMTKTNNAAGESALGDVIADAQLASTSPTDFGGAVVAFMNPGGIRADLVCSQACSAASPAPVTYNQLFNVQPFNNVMTVKTMTGDMIYRLLEQQFTGANGILQVSDGFAYSWSPTATPHVVPDSVTIDGVPVDKNASYRVAMNNFLASGGDGFSVFNEGTDPLGGEIDLDALVAYFEHNSPVGPGPQNRITRVP
ncbi:MAG TPA: bifunctional metallophosphatase/5'-nucleotidase [Gaiellaceae bacterium]|nr:bifunctional metallophosphatase/5'-nucleotidase [Gaiellaceae bacterium]